MPLKVRWSTLARHDLARALVYCAERDPDWAFAVDAAIAEKIEFLSEFPFLSTRLRPTHRGELREVLAGSHRIIFSVNEQLQEVFIVSIRHARQQDPEFLE
jgi:plasmid stabilization system protein ParE